MKISAKWHLLVIASVLLVVPKTFALNNRSAVSVNGVDTNPCTVPSPCRSFAHAVAVTAPGGDLVALDSAGYGPLTIRQAVTISGVPGVQASITATSGNGITVLAGAADRISIKNLTLIGAGASEGIIYFTGAELNLSDCLVRGFSLDGLEIDTQLPTNVLIENSRFFDNVFSGIALFGNTSGTGAFVRTTISSSVVQSSQDAIRCDGSTKTVIIHSLVTNNVNGIDFISTSGGDLPSDGLIEDSTIAFNQAGILVGSASGIPVSVTLARNELAFNTTAISAFSNPVVRTFGGNRFVRNGDNGPALSPLSSQ